MDLLLSLEAGSHVYDVYAAASPAALADGGEIERIGRLVTTSEMRYSPPDVKSGVCVLFLDDARRGDVLDERRRAAPN